ncbi:UDP-glucose dehydrogenase family protein [Humisphaera borealis]|uniref:UDP-glucose dehydrogenase family protein n=1 Tax=Humisphaera borealis TaxID=2807512 RepID=UPI0019D1AAA6|nr:UDP-glucose/GDP-mannose dehydrogenase family protein [Humisphaera borealis]
MALNISIIGTGYVGLVTGVCLASKGHRVTCVDIDVAKVDAINTGRAPIHEEGLPDLLTQYAGRTLTATTDLLSAVRGSDITFIATGTPFDGKVIDLKFVKQVSEQIGAALATKHGYHVVVVKSTVVPGTTDDVVKPLLEKHSGKRAGRDFGVGMNPEFLSEGVAIEDFMKPDRIVLGGMDDRSIDLLGQVYASFDDSVPRLRTNNRTAEMIKYASNAYQATCISFANEIGNLCASLGGIDALDVMAGVHLMKELSPTVKDAGSSSQDAAAKPRRVRAGITSFLSPGCGFGGSCFPKDVKALIAHGQAKGVAMPLLESVIEINRHQPIKAVDLLERRLGTLMGKRVAVLGLAFKPGTDDMRESPSIPIVKELLDRGAAVQAFDPIATAEARKIFNGKLTYAESLEQVIERADGILLVTRWPEFKRLPELLARHNATAAFVDGRRLIDRNAIPGYAGIGLGL